MTMWWTHLRRLAEYCDGQLPAAEAERATRHLDACPRCRASVDEFRFAAGLVRRLAIASPPESVWLAIDDALLGAGAVGSIRLKPDPTGAWDPPLGGLRLRGGLLPRRIALAAVLLVVALALGTSYWYVSREAAAWQVVRLAGSATVDRLTVGQALETDASSRLRLTVGVIGTVDVEPNTRVSLVSARASLQRLTLERGQITATISAPPRLFFVNTASSTVVDLGCKYTMQIDEGGAGRLRVELGWASLEWAGRQALVPAGASCATRPQVGPGTPSFDEAPLVLRDALARFDFENGGARALDVVLAESRVRDTLTLWHLLSRVDGSDRPRVYDRIVMLTPLPDGVVREKALALDPDTLERWRQELAWTW